MPLGNIVADALIEYLVHAKSPHAQGDPGHQAMDFTGLEQGVSCMDFQQGQSPGVAACSFTLEKDHPDQGMGDLAPCDTTKVHCSAYRKAIRQ